METATPIETYMLTARDSGLALDQLQNFLAGGYVAFPAMLPFHIACRHADLPEGPDAVALGGTRGPGKSFAALAQVGLDDCQRMPGLKVLFLRKIMKSAAEAFEDLIFKVLGGMGEYSPTHGRIVFPNTSRILIGGFKDESEIDKYLGIEYDLIVLEEATQLSERKMQLIGGSLRTTKPGWKARMYLTANPDGIGLKWFKDTFIIPYRAGAETFTRFIPVHYTNNPLLGAEYHRYLDGLSGPLRKAWRDADWDAFEGQAFPQWNQAVHVIDPIELPDHWSRWRAVDWGYHSPWCCLWLAQDPDIGRVYMYREAYETQLTDRQQARKILDLTPPGERIGLTYADPSMWARKRAGEYVTTTVDEYRLEGVMLTAGDNDRLSGKRKVDRLLANLPDGRPGLLVFSTCTNFIRTFPYLIPDEHRPEDVDTDLEDHAYDTLRYGLSNIREPRPPRKKTVPPLARFGDLL